jgi:hypothetical protein
MFHTFRVVGLQVMRLVRNFRLLSRSEQVTHVVSAVSISHMARPIRGEQNPTQPAQPGRPAPTRSEFCGFLVFFRGCGLYFWIPGRVGSDCGFNFSQPAIPDPTRIYIYIYTFFFLSEIWFLPFTLLLFFFFFLLFLLYLFCV